MLDRDRYAVSGKALYCTVVFFEFFLQTVDCQSHLVKFFMRLLVSTFISLKLIYNVFLRLFIKNNRHFVVPVIF